MNDVNRWCRQQQGACAKRECRVHARSRIPRKRASETEKERKKMRRSKCLAGRTCANRLSVCTRITNSSCSSIWLECTHVRSISSDASNICTVSSRVFVASQWVPAYTMCLYLYCSCDRKYTKDYKYMIWYLYIFTLPLLYSAENAGISKCRCCFFFKWVVVQ